MAAADSQLLGYPYHTPGVKNIGNNSGIIVEE
jgi:hypothetical protein